MTKRLMISSLFITAFIWGCARPIVTPIPCNDANGCDQSDNNDENNNENNDTLNAPASLTATQDLLTSINLTWAAVNDSDVTAYEIYRGDTEDQVDTLIMTTNDAAVDYNDVITGTHYYKVRAVSENTDGSFTYSPYTSIQMGKTGVAVQDPPQPINLAPYAYVSASGYTFEDSNTPSQRNRHNPIYVKDGSKGNTNEFWDYYTWEVTDDINASWIKLEWSTPVVIDEVRLYDHPKLGRKIKAGLVQFEKVPGATYTIFDKDFGELDDAGIAATVLTGPGEPKPVKSIKILILSHVGDTAGLNELEVIGYRVPDKTTDYFSASPNLALFAKVTDASPAVSAVGNATDMAGPYSPRLALDGNPETYWFSSIMSNGFITFEFDIPQCINRVVLVENLSPQTLTQAKIILNDTIELTGNKVASADEMTINIFGDNRKDVQKIMVRLVNGNYLNEIRVTPCP